MSPHPPTGDRCSAFCRNAARLGWVALTLAGCHGDGVGPAAVASVAVQPDSVSLLAGQSVQLTATVRDAAGSVLAGRSVTWTSDDAAKASVSSAGLVTANGGGLVAITASCEGKSGRALVVAQSPASDWFIADAQFTQGVQDPSGSLPMVLSGAAAVVNVLVGANQPSAQRQPLRLRLFDQDGNLVRSDTASTSGTLDPDPSSNAQPSAQFLVPASVLRPDLTWDVGRDPNRVAPDDSAANDVFPRGGRAPLATVTVATLRVRFVPISLAASGGATGEVSVALLPAYLRTVRSIHPLGPIVAEIGQPFSTSASFGTPPSGGEAAFWQQVLGELDLARTTDTAAATHWYGVVKPPPGFNYTAFGGFAYIPNDGQSTGAGTRTAVGVQVNWFNRPTQARDLVAHELAHNFGRRHSPCGNPSNVDPNYPDPSGTILQAGYDVYAWEQGLAANAALVPASTGDVMGYCFPAWSSAYTARGILEFRQNVVTSPPMRIAALVVRGRIAPGGGVTLDPAFVLKARPTAPNPGASYHVDGLAADGRVLFSQAFEPAELDHAADRHFLVAVPATPALQESLYTLHVRGPAGQATTQAAGGPGPAPPAPGLGLDRGSAIRGSDGLVDLTCADPSARGIAVLDGATNILLGTASSATMRVVAAPGAPLAVLCSDGVRSGMRRTAAP